MAWALYGYGGRSRKHMRKRKGKRGRQARMATVARIVPRDAAPRLSAYPEVLVGIKR